MKIVATISPEVIVKMFAKCCISNKMGGSEGEEDVVMLEVNMRMGDRRWEL
jgi:hypothetical protein